MVNVVRRTAVALAAAGLVLTACGTTEDATPIASDEPAPTSTESDSSEVTVGAPAETEPPAETKPSAATVASEAAPALSDPPPPVVPEAILGGRAFATELSPTSDFPENALPDIQVDDIRRQTKVALRNVFPAERPVLLWLWAPH